MFTASKRTDKVRVHVTELCIVKTRFTEADDCILYCTDGKL